PHLLVFLTDTPTTEISTLSLHDALPIYAALATRAHPHLACPAHAQPAAFDRHPASGEHLVVRRVQAGGLEVQRHRRQPLERGRGRRQRHAQRLPLRRQPALAQRAPAPPFAPRTHGKSWRSASCASRTTTKASRSAARSAWLI